MKKLFILLLVLVMLLTLFTACRPSDETPDDTTDGTTDTPDDSTDGPDKPTAKRLSTPIVTISDDGVASWDAVEGAVSYSIAIGTYEQYDEYRQTATRFQLSDGDTVKVKAIGNGTTTTDSHYSKGKTYIAILPTAFTSISEMADVPLNKAYRVQGIVCAVGNANLLLTDNDSNFLYVYTEQPHNFKIGDEIMLAGTKCEYWNTYELTNIRESEIISTGNTVKTPFVVEGDGDYFEGVMSDFTVGEYVTVTGRVQVNGNYYNFKVDELDSALLSLAYQGEPLEDGKLYTVTGYLAFISGESNKYINIIVTEIIPVEEGDTEEICSSCGEPISSGNHADLPCSHKACEDGNHTQCDACDVYLCLGGNHTVLDCGHKACANGEHTKCDTCDEYLCFGGNHTVLDCGHKACLDGEHTKCDFCDGYICQGDHSECKPIIIQTCPTCGEALVVGRHDMLECGHRECQVGEHEKCSKCKEYICHGGNHKALPCSHKACEDGTHIKCDTCDGYLCLGGNHALLDCGHKACADGEHTKCDTCDEYLCLCGNHTVLDCGHKACLDGEHELCLCGDYLCIGEHGGLACMERSTFAEIYAGENEQIFCTEGIICAKGYYEFMLTDNNGKYLHVASDVAHPYTIGDKIVIRGYRWAEGNVTYDLIPIEAQLISSNNSVRTPEKQKVNATYFINCLNGYRMGDYIEFTGTLTTEYGYYDFILSGMFTYVTMVYANPNLLDSGKNYTVTGYLLWVDSDWCWIIATSCVERIGSPESEYCPVCNQQLLYGNHELLECGHHACEEGNHERCGYCGDFYCLGGEHGICYGCRQAICNGEEHGLCGVCGWYLCKGEHFILPCGHKVCASGSHGNCDTCGQYLCHGGAHYYLDCGHRVCSGGTHKQCPRCGEYTCNAPDHELCEHCGTYECVGEHKKCPACLAAICNQPDHKLCPICGGYVCIGDHSDCEEIGEEDGEEENENVYTAVFIYSTVHNTSEDKYYFENDDITRPLERFYIIAHWNRSWNYLIQFAPHDDGTFTLTANYDTGSELLGYLPYYTFTGTYTKSGATYHLNYTAADHLSVDLMIHKGTYFPLTYSDSIEVNEEDKTFVTTELLTFILAEQYNYQQYGRKCYYCKTEIREEQMHLHITSCGTCGKQMCEGGGVGAHLYFDDTINHAKHYDVADEDKRWDVKYFNEVINPSTPPPKSETESDEEDE